MNNQKPKLQKSTLILIITLIVILFLSAGGILYLYLSGSISASTPTPSGRGRESFFTNPTGAKTATAKKTATVTTARVTTATGIKINFLLDGRPYYHDGRVVELWDKNTKLSTESTSYGELKFQIAPNYFPIGKVTVTVKATKNRDYKNWAQLNKEIVITSGKENNVKLNYITQNNIWTITY